ncbi:MAG: dihydrodipicolinate synthase family protein [Planctomycetaceae bacterium]|nr:dihydrodipicolinate synthase family protein [Planctomycetaceae bacterium]
MSQPFDQRCLRTVHLVPLTAYDDTGAPDLDAQAEHIARMSAAGISAFLPAAGTSEFHNLSTDEVVEQVRVTCEASDDDAVVFAPVGYQVQHAIEIGERSMELGADGIMFMPFTHPYLCDDGVRDYILTVLDAATAPALIYKKGDFPSDRLLLEMADHPLVVGIKYAVNEMNQFRRTVAMDGGRIEWLCGTAERYAPFYMLAGSTGYTTGAGNLCPHLTLAMHAAFAAGEYAEGMRLQELILPIEEYRARQGDSYNVSMLKFGMQILGHSFGAPRPPQRRLTPAEEREIATLLEPILAAESELRSELVASGLTEP